LPQLPQDDASNRFADNTSAGSVAAQLRRQRFQILLKMVDDFAGPVEHVDSA
jgi:hypothetical protein